MEPQRLPDGRLLIPMRAEDGTLIGDAMVVIGPDDAEYADWEAEIARAENRVLKTAGEEWVR